MRTPFGRLAVCLVLLWLACACSSSMGLPSRQIQTTKVSSSPLAGKFAEIGTPALILGQNPKPVVLFDAMDEVIGTLDTAGGATATDPQGDIYIANFRNSPTLKIYASPYDSRPAAITFKGFTSGVAVDWKTGVFAVPTEPNCCYGSVEFFKHGATKPCAVVKKAPGMENFSSSATFDASGVLFVAVGIDNGSQAEIASVSGECKATKFVQYTPALRYISHLQFNADNELVVDPSTGFSSPPIMTFAHPSNGALGKLLHSTTLDQINGKPVSMIALTNDGKYVWAAPTFNTGVGLYKYPAGGAPIKKISGYYGIGGAVNPPLLP